MEMRDGNFPSWQSPVVQSPVDSRPGGVMQDRQVKSVPAAIDDPKHPAYHAHRRSLRDVPLSLDDVAFEAWKIILQRDYAGKHRDSPADAAQIAYDYAEAFVARRGQG